MPPPATPKPAIDLCVVMRASPDWASLSAEEFDAQARAFCVAVRRPTEQVVETARLWDRTFRVSYRETRALLKNIAQEALAWTRVWEVLPAPPEAVRPGAVYALTDDDDWFSPGLPEALAEAGAAGGSYEGIVWGCAVLGPIRKGAREPVLEQPTAVRFRPLDVVSCQSNNYAVGAAYFARAGASWGRVHSHGHADEEFRVLRVCSVPRYLSIKNTNPASTVFLENGLRPEFTPRRLRELVAQYVARFDAGRALEEPDLQWAREPMERTRRFFGELLGGAR